MTRTARNRNERSLHEEGFIYLTFNEHRLNDDDDDDDDDGNKWQPCRDRVTTLL